MSNNLILTGIMGSGKSSVGQELCNLTRLNLLDTDTEIEKSTGLKISDIFNKFGETYFRELENKLISELSLKNDIIISLGGGAFCNAQNIKNLKKSGTTIYLKTSINEILKRLSPEEIEKRPLLKNIDNLKTLIEKREFYYDQADIIILTDGKNIKDIAKEILIKAAVS